MGLNTIASVLEKKGQEYVDRFLTERVVVTEKLDTYRVLFEKRDGKLVFFKKDNTELNLVERTLTNIWEDVIIELSTSLNNINIQEGLRFGIAYTPVEKPIRLSYNNIPKYVLTDVTVRKNGKVTEVLDYNSVNEWSIVMGIGRPPIIFDGVLSEQQKTSLLEYANGQFDQKFGSFSSFITSTLGQTYSNEDVIEGIIIKGDNDLVQLVSPEFNIINEMYEKVEQSRDFYDIILTNLSSFMNRYSMPVLEGSTPDEVYLEITSDIFNRFCEEYPNLMESVQPSYLTPPAYGYYGTLNTLLIKNKKTLSILEHGGNVYEALFRVIVSSLRKPKKEYGLLSESVVSKFNTYVSIIQNVVYNNSQVNPEPLLESDRNVVIKEMKRREYTDIDNMRVIASIQKAFEPAILDVTKGQTRAVVYITSCQPFTQSQLDNIESINRTWKCPVILASVSNKRHARGDNFHFSDELVLAQLKAIASAYKQIVPSYFMVDSWSLSEIFEFCRPHYEPLAVITDTGKKSQYAIQLFFEDEVMGGRIGVEQDFNIGEMENKDALYAYRAIEDKMVVKFKDHTPSPIWGLFDTMISEYLTWTSNGVVSHAFQENKFI